LIFVGFLVIAGDERPLKNLWISFSNVLDFFLICFGFLVIAGYERPVENNADLEANPDVHQAVEDDEAGKGKPIGCTVAAAGCVLRVVRPKYPKEPDNGPGKASKEEDDDQHLAALLATRIDILRFAKGIIDKVDCWHS